MEVNKYNGEKFTPKAKRTSLVIEANNEDINEKYLKGEIRIVTEQARYHLYTIPDMLKSGKFDLNPEYQRRKRWDNIQKSKLIESFIINVPIPPIFLYEEKFAEYEVMDGLQRLTAIGDFYNDLFKLEGLEEWKELNGKNYSSLPVDVKKGIDRRYLSSIILLNETAKTKLEAEYLKQIVFERLNSGGDKLVPQETRNALYGGKLNNLCLKLSENDNFRKMFKFPLIKKVENKVINENDLLEDESFRKMLDVELVLRFFAFRHLDDIKGITQEKFLDQFLFQANSFSDEIIEKYEILFNQTIEIIYSIYGESAFFMPTTGSRKKSKPTRTVFDSLMQVISNKIENKAELLLNSAKIKEETYKDKDKLFIDGKVKNDELFDGKYNSFQNIKSRIIYFDQIISSVLKN